MDNQLPTIDKNVPLPSSRFNEGHPFAVLRKLQSGDSVFFRGVMSGGKAYKVLSNRMSYLKNTQGMMLTARSVIENGSKGVRVWRRA
jgi:sortase (surface protein transpeptidase)|tara:strand:+ start:1061 stop:1321 length:261 start_codon:yes stop_codon:yes gene_type:complete